MPLCILNNVQKFICGLDLGDRTEVTKTIEDLIKRGIPFENLLKSKAVKFITYSGKRFFQLKIYCKDLDHRIHMVEIGGIYYLVNGFTKKSQKKEEELKKTVKKIKELEQYLRRHSK